MDKVNHTQIEQLLFIEQSTGEKIVDHLVEMFREQIASICPQINDCIKNNELNQASFLAHKLKSSASNLGFNFVEKTCLKIETEARKRSPLDFYQLVTDIENQSKEALSEMETILKSSH